ncbi:MAG: transcription-repair coupling factor [Pedosphaera sp.]|nr:transcription-repair coupling factor [Pedosphaera sp.]
MGQIQDIIERASRVPAVQELVRRLGSGGVLSCGGVELAAQPFLVALLSRLLPRRPWVFVTESLKTQETVQQDLETWLGLAGISKRPLFFPEWEVLPHENRLPHADVISERLETLQALAAASDGDAQSAPIITVTAAGLMQRTFSRDELRQRSRRLRVGDTIAPLDLIDWLQGQGYEPEAQVSHRGQIALRGGIVDVFPFTSPWPVRCEFFGDELESLRFFHPHTQVSTEKISEALLSPGGELGLVRKTAATTTAVPTTTLLDHLPGNAIFFLSQPEVVETHVAEYTSRLPAGDEFHLRWESVREQMTGARRSILEMANGSVEAEALDAGTVHIEFSNLDALCPTNVRRPDQPVMEAQRRELFAQLHRWSRQGHDVVVCCNNEGERERFTEIHREQGFADAETRLRTAVGALSRGFLFSAGQLVVVTDAEIFARYKVQRPRRLKSRHAQATRSAFDIDFSDLDDGDFVVHIQYGIGRYAGLQKIPFRVVAGDNSESVGEECLVIEYAPSDPEMPAPKLYVPVSEAHLVSKYVGAGKVRPSLNTLGGKRWQKAKEHAEKAVRDLAAEMLSIQAARESQAGHAFGVDTTWQREFEASFLYEETPDQHTAINATKQDMQVTRPMDRLICGDVGFGKTEVAIRAAFKAIMDGRQVAVMVPTTVLAQQHFNTFSERMADYPVRVELLSRFRTPRQQKQVVREIASGQVDLVIGTHRLIQPDVVFKELGLVVIDEEQRFGVMHKERFKLLRRMVDVLTLSATPIPRTLYMALTGARDMSTIETPPQDRLPVETIVVQYDERIIRQAIEREMNRGGQIFFLHNRVTTIHAMEQKLRALVPSARILVGHGQMKSDDLEDVMARFVNGEADVLLCTTIIESGIDIPNANTIIIDRADRFGLSDLYQLRGRVGRYKHQAYAYILLPRHAALLADVRKRISAIKQYSSLGSGFKIAMRDLEIRGAGNLLGSEQSGHITAVGFELYCQLLKQSVAALKGEKTKPRVEVNVRLDFLMLGPEPSTATKAPPVAGRRKKSLDTAVPRDNEVWVQWDDYDVQETVTETNTCAVAAAYLPVSYIADSRQRIDIYRKLAQATTPAAVETVKAELRDRFGKYPEAVELLLALSEIKILAAEKAITSVETETDRLKLMRNGDYISLGGKFPRLAKTTARSRLREIRMLLAAL